MIHVSILGCGVVGAATADLLLKNNYTAGSQSVKLQYVLDLRDLSGTPYAPYQAADFSVIESDPTAHIVVECIGGATVALDFTRRALSAGKHVVTSNKELVAAHGAELLALAAEKNVNFLFEASVGGGIPIIRPLHQCLTANTITDICGILNGTTNYIITNMKERGLSFETALAEAQERGYAEADPTDDIMGKDTARKICILASLAFGTHINPEQVETQGITELTADDIAYADANNYAIKLLGRATMSNGKLAVWVAPHFVPHSSPLYGVNDVFNGITVQGDATGTLMFYGRGAGALPTASAVIADVLDAANHNQSRRNILWQPSSDMSLLSPPSFSGTSLRVV